MRLMFDGVVMILELEQERALQLHGEREESVRRQSKDFITAVDEKSIIIVAGCRRMEGIRGDGQACPDHP